MRMRRIRFAAIGALSLVAFVPAAHSAQRTFVSKGGNDLNACSLAAPTLRRVGGGSSTGRAS